jgi:hypothetical protein
MRAVRRGFVSAKRIAEPDGHLVAIITMIKDSAQPHHK